MAYLSYHLNNDLINEFSILETQYDQIQDEDEDEFEKQLKNRANDLSTDKKDYSEFGS